MHEGIRDLTAARCGMLLAALLMLGACNTMSGAGQDIEAAGDAISDTAEDTQEQM